MDRRQTAALVAASAALSCGLALAVARMRKRPAPAHDERVVPSLPGGAALDESVDSSVDSIADALPHIVWRSSADGSRRYSNARWSEATGLPVEASKGRGWLESIAPADIERTRRAWKHALGARVPLQVDHRVRNETTGTYRWFSMRAVPVFDADGRLDGWIGSDTDVDERSRREGRLQVLVDAGTRLLSALDVHEAFDALLRVIVTSCADAAFIARVDPAGTATVTDALQRSSKGPRRDQAFIGMSLSRQTPAMTSVREGKPLLWERLDRAEWFGELDAGRARELEASGLHSAVTVPIRAGHRVVALLATFASPGSSPYHGEELQVFCELALLLTNAVQSAESYQQQRQIATSFQRAALPSVLPSHELLAFDAVYEAGRSEALVGGDWYDAVELLDGRFLISIGDVCVNGPIAAVTMALVRHSVRAAAQVDAEPVSILDAADRALRAEGADRIVTAFVGVLDPFSDELTYASAGHPPALHRKPDGTLVELASRGLPLGLRVRQTGDSARVAKLEPGSLVAFYTDGLTEATRDLLEGERLLRDALEKDGWDETVSPARLLRARVLTGLPRDDVAILTLRRLRVPLPASEAESPFPSSSWSFQAGNHAAAVNARHGFTAALRDAGMTPERLETAETIFGELVGNAVRHTNGVIEVQLSWAGGRPVLHVLDEGAGYLKNPAPPRDQLSESGRGLFIVTALSEDFTVSPRPDGGSHSRAVLSAPWRRSRSVRNGHSTPTRSA